MSMTFSERFMSHVEKTDSCWNWTGAILWDGYGLFGTGTHGEPKNERAHRVSYQMFVGKIEPGKLILHSCANPKCVNPAHLRQGTHAENMADRDAHGRTARGNRSGHVTKPESTPRGANHPNAKLTPMLAITIRSMANVGLTQKKIASAFRLSSGTVSNVISGKAWC